MALTQRLEFRQTQSLVMTPQLMQAIKLLQLSNLDLSTFVEEELERNPLLERANDGPEPPVAGEAIEASPFADAGEAGGGEDAGGEYSAGSSEGFEPGRSPLEVAIVRVQQQLADDAVAEAESRACHGQLATSGLPPWNRVRRWGAAAGASSRYPMNPRSM